MVYHANLQAHNRGVANQCQRWKTWTPATNSQRAYAEIAFSHERGCKFRKCDAHRGRQAQKKVNGTEGENAISVFCNTPWTRTSILQKSVLSRWNGAQLFCIILMHGHEKRHRAWVTEQCVLCVFAVMKIKRLVREGLKKLKLWAARSVRTRIYFVYLQHGDKILEFVNTLNGLLQFLTSQGPTRSSPAHSFLIKELERTEASLRKQ